jgi:hypothetical protein
MARVTATEVKQIIDLDTSTVTDEKIEVFINMANLFINNTFSGVTSLSSDTLKEIERFLSAHFLHALDPRAISEKAGEVAVRYAGKFGMGLQATTYGQTALLLDTTGRLAVAAEGKKRASLGIISWSTE